MKKSLFPALIIGLLSLGGVYALTVNLFPSTPEFPRTPTGPGTIGGVIAKLIGTTAVDTYSGDGTVGNSEKLTGVTASGYLKNLTCTIVGGILIGIDADGRGICGPKNLLLVGHWTEGSNALKCPVGSGPCSPLTVGAVLYEGDIIKTTPTNTGTITFVDDLSILRLDVSTIVELQKGVNTSGDTIAQTILNNGQLWGRIVSNTGVNIGGGGVIAGVRGTSINVRESGGTYTVDVVDSTLASDAAHIYIGNGTPTPTMQLGRAQEIVYNSGANPTIDTFPKTLHYLYSASPWIRENTKKDLEYLYKIKNDAGVPETRQLLATNEYNATLHSTDLPALDALCDGTLVFWPSLVGTPHEKCQPGSRVAFADYTKGIPHHMLYSSNQVYVTISTGAISPVTEQGYSINAAGQAIIYNDTGFISSLAGKTITLKIGTNLSFGGNIFDGGNIQYKYIINSRCNAGNLIEIMRSKICKTITNTLGVTISDEYMPYTSGTTITLPITDFTNNPIAPERFILGAVKTFTSYAGPIKNTIQSIAIQ